MTFRPVLRPGAPLLRRDATHLQIGTSPGIVIDDRPGLFALLRLLDGVRDVERLQQVIHEQVPDLDRPVESVLTELRALGAVVDGPSRGTVRQRRGTQRIRFEPSPEAIELVETVRSILSSAGLVQQTSTEPDLVVFVSYGEVERSVLERAAVLGRTHLPVVIDEDRVRIGPFVCPSRTPCVGCHDLHRTDWDAAWPVLLHQLDRAPAPARPPALQALAAHAAAVEIAAEVLSHADGTDPRTIGCCLTVGPGHDERVVWPVAFHPRCSCDLLSAA